MGDSSLESQVELTEHSEIEITNTDHERC